MAVNLIKMQDQLKGMPDSYLTQLVQQPTGQVPQFLVLGELQRRKDMREGAAQAPETTVADDLEQEGLGALQQQAVPEEAPMEEPQPEQVDQGIAALPTEMEEAPAMAGGGIVAFGMGGLSQDRLVDSMRQTAGGFSRGPAIGSDVSSMWEKLKAMYQRGEISKAVIDNFLNANKELMNIANYKPFASNQPPTPPVAPAPGITGLGPEDIAAAGKAAAQDYMANMPPPEPTAPPVPNVGIGSLPGFSKAPDIQIEAPKLDTTIYDERLNAGAPTLQGISDEMAALRGQRGIDDDFFAKQSAEVQKERDALNALSDKNLYLSLAKAGAKMAAGTSPFALSNIAEGVGLGISDYVASEKDIRAEKRDLRKEDQAIARADQARREAMLSNDVSRYDKKDAEYRELKDKRQARIDTNLTALTAAQNEGKKLRYNANEKRWEVATEQAGLEARTKMMTESQDKYTNMLLRQQGFYNNVEEQITKEVDKRMPAQLKPYLGADPSMLKGNSLKFYKQAKETEKKLRQEVAAKYYTGGMGSPAAGSSGVNTPVPSGKVKFLGFE